MGGKTNAESGGAPGGRRACTPTPPDLPAGAFHSGRAQSHVLLPKPVPASRQVASGYTHAQALSGWPTLSPTREGCHIKWDERTESTLQSIPSSEFQKAAMPMPRGVEYANRARKSPNEDRTWPDP